MENKRLYSLIGQLALNYRLSLNNICKLLGKEPNDENKKEVYESIMSLIGDGDLKNAYNYLFNYETINENERRSSLAFSKAVIYLKRYTKAQKTNNQDELNILKKELVKLDENFKKIKNQKEHQHLSLEEVTIISKYRLKYCISQMQMCETLGISRKMLFDNENKITDPNLSEKLQLISNYYQDLTVNTNYRVK